jgi:uncharacterized protein YqjF (DUF2071 family)
VALRLSRVRPLRVPLPHELQTYSQINVRTYTTVGGKPGIWLLSVDCADRPTVVVSRLVFGVPYRHAEVTVEGREDGGVRARSRRRGDPGVLFEATYHAEGTTAAPEPGSLDDFLTNRLSVYGANRLGVLRADIDHGPWPLQEASADLHAEGLVGALGLRLPSDPPILHFASSIDVRGGPPVRIRG